MKKFFISIILTISMLPIFAQTVSLQNKLIQECEELILKKMESDKIVGVSAAVVFHDSIIWKKGFGYADKENEIPMTENTVVNIGSVTKTITALAIMQLHEDDIIDINNPINNYLPEFHPKTRNENLEDITIKSLLTHTSGIQRDYWKNSDLESGKYTDVLDFINETYLLYPAGDMGMYSNSAYNILGHLIKKVSGLDYPDYIHDKILKPFEMINSGFYMDSLVNKTKVYDGINEYTEYPLRDIASGGIYTDIVDLAKYAKGMLAAYNGKSSILEKKTTHKMFTIQNQDVIFEASKNKKGLGWFMLQNDSSLALLHQGSKGYAHAAIILFPKQQAALVILNNTSTGGSLGEDFCLNRLEHFQLSIPDLYPNPIIPATSPLVNSISVKKEHLKAHVGFYAESYSYSRVVLTNDSLRLLKNGIQYNLKPINKNDFIPVKLGGKDSLKLIDEDRYYFKEIGNYHVLIHKKKDKESVLGYKFKAVDSSKWIEKIGRYEHFGYQIVIGDTELKEANIRLDENKVMILELVTLDGKIALALDVISEKHAITAGVMSEFGFTVNFSENEKYHIVEISGITFRKKKNEITTTVNSRS